jgi:uncharacterized SAM-binding protein YcdF (DUF218 family)
MIGRLIAVVFLGWIVGFVWFAATLPRPATSERVDAVIVPTGGAGRIARGLAVLDEGLGAQMLVSGVDPEVRPVEFAAQFGVDPARMECCVTLGFAAVDTRSNAAETAQWVEENGVTSLRLVTSDWHMRRAAGELDRVLPASVSVVRDAVPTEANLATLFLEYHKLLASHLAGFIEQQV